MPYTWVEQDCYGELFSSSCLIFWEIRGGAKLRAATVSSEGEGDGGQYRKAPDKVKRESELQRNDGQEIRKICGIIESADGQ